MMPIRFQCPACSQPIEVDDEWASKAVACPYCLRTVTAPAESSLGEPSRVPLAKPVTGTPAAGATDATVAHPNRIAVAAMICACAIIVFFVLAWMLMAPHRLELEEMERELLKSTTLMERSNRILEMFGGQFPTWLMLGMMFQMSALGACLAGFICGAIGSRRPQNRGLAVTALAISTGFVIFTCSGASPF